MSGILTESGFDVVNFSLLQLSAAPRPPAPPPSPKFEQNLFARGQVKLWKCQVTVAQCCCEQ